MELKNQHSLFRWKIEFDTHNAQKEKKKNCTHKKLVGDSFRGKDSSNKATQTSDGKNKRGVHSTNTNVIDDEGERMNEDV